MVSRCRHGSGRRSTSTVRFRHYGQSWDRAGSTKAFRRKRPATFVARSAECATTFTGSSTERSLSRSRTAKRSTIGVTTLTLPARATHPVRTVVVRIRTILRLSRTARTMDRSPNHPAVRNRLKTHCPHGHPYDQANTRVTSHGGRVCKACNRAAQQRFRRTPPI